MTNKKRHPRVVLSGILFSLLLHRVYGLRARIKDLRDDEVIRSLGGTNITVLVYCPYRVIFLTKTTTNSARVKLPNSASAEANIRDGPMGIMSP